MPSFGLKPASAYSTSQIADMFTRSFEGYFVPVNINETTLLTILRRDGVDLSESRILLKDDVTIGLALIARRGWTSRLAAMGIVPEARHSGVGTWVMNHLADEARARGEKEMVLEVIEQNTAGVNLYQKIGFKTLRRLVGFKLENPQIESQERIEEVDIRHLAQLVTSDGLQDLPWQLSGETISQHAPPSRAFRLNDAFCLISNPEAEHVVISSVLVKANSRRAGQGSALMRAVFSRFPNKIWHVSAILPEEISAFFEKIGMKREELSQLQMFLTL